MTPSSFPPLQRGILKTLQVNLGYACNQACSHCHVGAGPWRLERMDAETIALIPEVLRVRRIQTLDLTGGAPELHPDFRSLVQQTRGMGIEVIDRCNLTILLEDGQEDLGPFLATHGVTVIASLPCYLPETVDRQRGSGVFSRSIEALRRLNRLGYGHPDSGLALHLVHNPAGATLPPPQTALEASYKEVLFKQYGVVFNQLNAMSNMPIQRFADQLRRDGILQEYMDLLRANHAAANVERVMCRSLLSVSWEGTLYDCDFNQMLGLPSHAGGHLRDLLVDSPQAPIQVGEHCYGCTAGNGSSCGGALKLESAVR